MRFRLGVLLALTAAAMFGQPAPSPEAVARGKKEYQQACSFCHGVDATGSRGPDLVRSAVVNHDTNGDTIGPVIRNGRPDKGMPPIPMTDRQIADVAAFLHDRALQALHSSHVPVDYPLEKLLTGNVSAGRAYFNGAGKCSTCHSPEGDLKGVATKYTPINLQSRFLYPAGAPVTATVTLRPGQQFSGRVVEQDEFNIAIRNAAGWYRSWPKRAVRVEVHDPLEAHRHLLSQYTDKDVHNLFAYLETLK